jgi:hypothetical protein
MRRRVVTLLMVMTVAFVALASPVWTTTFTVYSTGDQNDLNFPASPGTPNGICDSDPTASVACTLRGAIQEAMANSDPTVDVIKFAIPGCGPHTISPNPELPDLDHMVPIDGYTEALGEGATPAIPNTLAFGTNAVLKIVISGASAPLGSDGFDIEAGHLGKQWPDNRLFQPSCQHRQRGRG